MSKTDEELERKLQIAVEALRKYANEDTKLWEYGCGCCCCPVDEKGDKDWDRYGDITYGHTARLALTAIQSAGSGGKEE